MNGARWVFVAATYERSVGNDYPVVEHRFYGRTREDAHGYYRAHLKTDAFLAGCVERQRWSAVRCTVQTWWEEL